MADDPGSSNLSLTSSYNHKPNKLPLTGDAEWAEFNRIFQSMLSPDSQMRKDAESQFEQIPHKRKLSLLFRRYEKAENDEYRYIALDRLQNHIEIYWDRIFPNSWTNEVMSEFCRQLLNAVQYDNIMGDPVREKLTKVIAVVAKCRLDDNSGAQNWEELIEYMRTSAQSATNSHALISLAIVQEVPYIFGSNGEACHDFFESCLQDKDPSIQSAAIKAFVAVYSMPKCAVEIRAVLDIVMEELAQVIRSNYVRADEIDAHARNDFAFLFVRLCVESSNIDMMKMGLEVVQNTWVGRDCLPNIKILFESCLSNANSEIRSTALKTYCSIITEGDNEQSPLLELFLRILSMCEDYVSQEDEQENVTEGKLFSPLDCISGIASECLPLIRPHLRTIVNLCRESIDNSFQSQSISSPSKRNLCYNILNQIISEYQEELVNLFGDAYITGMYNRLIECAFVDESEELTNLMVFLAGQERMATKIKQFVQYCIDSDNSRHKKMAWDIIRKVPDLFDNLIDMKSLVEKSLTDTDTVVRLYALLAFVSIAESRKKDRVEILGSTTLIILQMAEVDAATGMNLSAIECIDDLSRLAPDLLQANISLVITFCCRMSLIPHEIVRETVMNIFERLCLNSADIIKNDARDLIPMIWESVIVMAATADLQEVEEEWIEQQHIDLSLSSSFMIDRIVEPLMEGENVLTLLDIASKLAQDVNWWRRYSSVLALNALGRRSTKYSMKITSSLIAALNDQQPRVRNVACSAIMMMVSSRTNLQDKCGHIVLPALITVLKEITVPRLAANAGKTISSFILFCSNHLVINFESILHEIIDHLHSTYITLLFENRANLLKHTLAPICSLAEKDPLLIYSFYNQTMAPLKSILNERPKNEILAVVIECISQCGKAAGKTQFLPDAKEVLSHIIFDIESFLNMDDRGEELFPASFDRIIAVIGQEAARFLPSLVPLLITAYTDYDECFRDTEESRRDIIRKRGETPQSMLKSLAAESGASFEPYVNAIAPLALNHITRNISIYSCPCGAECAVGQSDSWGANIFPHLFASINMRDEESVDLRSLWIRYLSALKRGMVNSKNISLQVLKSLVKCIEEIGKKNIADEELKVIQDIMEVELKARKEKLMNGSRVDSEADWHKIITEEMFEIIHSALMALGTQFIPVVDKFLPYLSSLIDKDNKWNKCINDEILNLTLERSKIN